MALLRKLTADEKRTVGHWTMELVVVVAGVLIALWLQQWGERRRTQQDMHSAEAAIHDEVRSALTSLIFREAVSKCHFERAERLKTMLLANGPQWPGLDENPIIQTVPRIGPMANRTVVPSVYFRPLDTFTTAAWTSALATGALEPMDRGRFAQLVSLYDEIQRLSQTRDLEDKAAAKLSALAFPLQLTPDLRVEMLQAVYDVDRSRFVFALAGPDDFAAEMRKLGWNDRTEVDQWIREQQADETRLGLLWRDCVARPRNPFAGH